MDDLSAAERDPATADCLIAALATVCAQDGRTAEAEVMVKRAVKALRGSNGRAHETTLLALNNLAGVTAAGGDDAGAVRIFREVLVDLERVFGPDHPNVVDVGFNLTALEWRAGDRDGAVQRMKSLLAAVEASGGGDALRLAGPRANFGKMLWHLGRLEEAAAHYQRAIDIRLALSPEPDVVFSGYYNDLARIRHDQGRPVDSLELLRTSVRLRIAALGPLHAKVLPRRLDLAACELHTAGDREAALAHLQAIDGLLVAEFGAEHYVSIYSQQLLAECMFARGEPEQARVYVSRLEERARRSGEPARWAPAISQLRAMLPP